MRKAADLLATLLRDPNEFITRAASSIEVRLESALRPRTDYQTQAWDEVMSQINTVLKVQLASFMAEPGLQRIEETVRTRLSSIPAKAPFPSFHNGDFRVARLSYALVRALAPGSVVETGVCYGVTTSFILAALEQNGAGQLYSIDMPPLGDKANDFVGWLIPKELRARWHLYIGSSKDLLPDLLAKIRTVEVFLHDSKHTYRNIWRELRTVTPWLARRSCVVADDVEANPAFLEWVSARKPAYSAVVGQEKKNSLMGIAAFAEKPHPAGG
jgi:predicted O-methyltransferase YrrM